VASPLDPFIPNPDVRERHAVLVKAPADMVSQIARDFDMQTLPLVHAIFWLRNKVLRSAEPPPERGMGLVAATQSFGWGILVDEPGRVYVSGATCQPWLADVVFTALPPEAFAAYAVPDHVKIVWSVETEPLEPALTRLSTETRVVSTDEAARAKFRRYWRMFGIGILAIRWFMLPAVRREAEARWRAEGAAR
jgi:hypothetical protein